VSLLLLRYMIAQTMLIPVSHGRLKMTDTSNDYHTIFAINLRPKSAGTVTCSSGDMFDPPIIDHNYLSDPEGYDKRVGQVFILSGGSAHRIRSYWRASSSLGGLDVLPQWQIIILKSTCQRALMIWTMRVSWRTSRTVSLLQIG
jgi:hypothetical protein